MGDGRGSRLPAAHAALVGAGLSCCVADCLLMSASRPASGLQPDQAARRAGRAPPQQQVVLAADGRVRRRAVFGADALPANGADGYGSSEDDDEDDDEEEEGSGEEEGGSSSGEDAEDGWQQAAAAAQQRQRGGSDSEQREEEDEGSEEEGSEGEDDEGMGAAAAWKAKMLERAAALFRWAPAGVCRGDHPAGQLLQGAGLARRRSQHAAIAACCGL